MQVMTFDAPGAIALAEQLGVALLPWQRDILRRLAKHPASTPWYVPARGCLLPTISPTTTTRPARTTMSNSEFPDPDEMRRAKVRGDGYVIDDKGEEAHMVTHISGSTSILVPDDQDDTNGANRYPFLHLTLFFRDGHPPVTALLNPAFVIGLMGDCVAMFKTMMGVEDMAVVPDTVPDFDDMPLAPDDPYSYSEPQPDDYGHDGTEEIPPPGEDDYHG